MSSSRIMLASAFVLAMFFVAAKGSVPEYTDDQVKNILAEIAGDSIFPRISGKCYPPAVRHPWTEQFAVYGSEFNFYGTWKCESTGVVAVIKPNEAQFTLSQRTIELSNRKLRTYKPKTDDNPVMFLEQEKEWWIVMPFLTHDSKPKLAWYSTAVSPGNPNKPRFFVYSKLGKRSRSRRASRRATRRSQATNVEVAQKQEAFIRQAAGKGDDAAQISKEFRENVEAAAGDDGSCTTETRSTVSNSSSKSTKRSDSGPQDPREVTDFLSGVVPEFDDDKKPLGDEKVMQAVKDVIKDIKSSDFDESPLVHEMMMQDEDREMGLPRFVETWNLQKSKKN